VVLQLWGSKTLIKKWITAISFLICLLLIAVSYFYWDIPLAIYCKGLNRSIVDIAEIVTILGEARWYYILLILAYLPLRIIWKNKAWSMKLLFIFLSLSASGLINMLVKWLAGRNRPINYFTHGLYGFNFFGVGYELTSLPSGHTVTAFSWAFAVSILFPRASIAAFIIAISIGMSRIILTSHYLSDVIAGAGIGILSTLLVKYFFDRKKIELIQK
jgi:membrane-associated phospholipid phosphatase